MRKTKPKTVKAEASVVEARPEEDKEALSKYKQVVEGLFFDNLGEAQKGAISSGLAKTEQEAEAVVMGFLSKCRATVWATSHITKFIVDDFGCSFFVKWAFTHYNSWVAFAEKWGETEAILSGVCTLVNYEGEEASIFGSNTNAEGIIERWEEKIKPLQDEIRKAERARKKAEASLVDTKRQEAGLFSVNSDNEIIAKLFPTNGERGRFSIDLRGGGRCECFLKHCLNPIDVSVFASLVSSIVKNTAINKQGEEFYYISQKAFCRAFFGLEKDKRGVSDTELKIIEESIDRLANARFVDIDIAEDDTSMKISYDLKSATITANPRYLPIYEYERDLPNLVNKAPAWVIKKSDFNVCPTVELATAINRIYAPYIKLIPLGVHKTESLTSAVFSILNRYILRWYEGIKEGMDIDLEAYKPLTEEGEGLSRQAISQRNTSLRKALVATLLNLEKEGGCTFAVGSRTKRGGLRYGGRSLSTVKSKTLENVRFLRLTKVDRSQWKKVALKKEAPTDPEAEKDIAEEGETMVAENIDNGCRKP